MEGKTSIKQNSMKAWMLAARPKTLTGAAVPVMIGVVLAFVDSKLYTYNVFSITAAILCLLFAFTMQIDANFINDFFDCINGNDDETRLGPRRACAQGWISIDAMKKGIALTTVAACIIGLPLVIFGGFEMILVGLICVIFCFLYTTHLSYMGLGDLLVIVFFGMIPVCISYYVQLHTVTLECFVASIASGIVIDTLLIVNNFRDCENDKKAGKNTLVVRLGLRLSGYLYMSIGLIACIIGLTYWRYGQIWAFILPFIYLFLHLLTYNKMMKFKRGKALNIILGQTARNIFIYGLTVVIGILLN
jgi:1,4-dihydroxy-2-naphthoate octaprenyltransferase